MRTLLFSCQTARDKAAFCTAILLVASLTGCALQPSQTTIPEQSVQAKPVDPNCADTQIRQLYAFIRADTDTRTALHEQASLQALLKPTPSNRLQLAIFKAWPGHTGYNPETAGELLRGMLEAEPGMSAGVKSLANVLLAIISEQQQLSGRNRFLAAELKEARKKLEALTAIERAVETNTPEIGDHDQVNPDDNEAPAKNPVGG